MKHILVTGGLGFIGSHLVDRLLAEGHSVDIVDDCSSNVVDWTDYFIQDVDARWTRMTVAQFCQHNHVSYDEIYHLASPVGAAGVLGHSGQMVKQIVNDTYAIMELAQRCKAKLVCVSTSEIYGGGLEGGLCAEDSPRLVAATTTPRLEYAVAKLAAETALINTALETDLNAVIVRPFNVAGARQSSKNGFVLPRFIEQALRGGPLTVFGSGMQQRAFTNVADIVAGLQLAMLRGKSGEAYNLGNSRNKTTVLDLAERVIRHIGGGSIVFTDGKTVFGKRFAEAADKLPIAEKAHSELNWRPTRGIDQTITEAFIYASEVRDAQTTR